MDRNAMRTLGRWLRRLGRDQRGIVVPTFALVVTAILVLSLAGIDLIRLHLVQARTVAALDAAVLAAGRNLGGDNWRQVATAFFWANMPQDYMGASVGDPVLTTTGQLRTGQEVTMSVDVDLPLLVGGFLEITQFELSASNTARRTVAANLELVLAMDNSGSMAGGKLAAMQGAARYLLDTLFGADDSVPGFAVGLVPFNSTVKVGTEYINWLAKPWPHLFVPSWWDGCLMERMQGNTPSLDATPPDEVAFQPYFSDKLLHWLWVNDNLYCTAGPVQFLTPSRTLVDSRINTMSAKGNTLISLGMVWGWRMLSPAWRGADGWGHGSLPRDPGPDMTKAVVLLTDGDNYVGGSLYTPFDDAFLGGQGRQRMDAYLRTACTRAKAAGIEVFTISFGGGMDHGTKQLMRLRQHPCAVLPCPHRAAA